MLLQPLNQLGGGRGKGCVSLRFVAYTHTERLTHTLSLSHLLALVGPVVALTTRGGWPSSLPHSAQGVRHHPPPPAQPPPLTLVRPVHRQPEPPPVPHVAWPRAPCATGGSELAAGVGGTMSREQQKAWRQARTPHIRTSFLDMWTWWPREDASRARSSLRRCGKGRHKV